MALQINYQYKGTTVYDAYLRIGHIDGNKTLLNFNLVLYSNKNLSDIDVINNNPSNMIDVIGIFSIIPDLNSTDNILVQCYNYLKLQPEFQDAIDV